MPHTHWQWTSYKVLSATMSLSGCGHFCPASWVWKLSQSHDLSLWSRQKLAVSFQVTVVSASLDLMAPCTEVTSCRQCCQPCKSKLSFLITNKKLPCCHPKESGSIGASLTLGLHFFRIISYLLLLSCWKKPICTLFLENT